MKNIKQILIPVLMAAFLFFYPFIARGETNETTVSEPENYLVNGKLFHKESSSNEQQLNLQNGNETLILHRDGMHWYSDNGEVIPEPYLEASTSETATETSAESSVGTTEPSTVNVPESTIEKGTVNESTSKNSPVSAAFSSESDTIKESKISETTSTTVASISSSESKSTPISSNVPAMSSKITTAASSVTSQPLATAPTNSSARKELPKTGSQTQQSLFLTFTGTILLLAILIWLPFELRRRNN